MFYQQLFRTTIQYIRLTENCRPDKFFNTSFHWKHYLVIIILRITFWNTCQISNILGYVWGQKYKKIKLYLQPNLWEIKTMQVAFWIWSNDAVNHVPQHCVVNKYLGFNIIKIYKKSSYCSSILYFVGEHDVFMTYVRINHLTPRIDILRGRRINKILN